MTLRALIWGRPGGMSAGFAGFRVQVMPSLPSQVVPLFPANRRQLTQGKFPLVRLVKLRDLAGGLFLFEPHYSYDDYPTFHLSYVYDFIHLLFWENNHDFLGKTSSFLLCHPPSHPRVVAPRQALAALRFLAELRIARQEAPETRRAWRPGVWHGHIGAS